MEAIEHLKATAEAARTAGHTLARSSAATRNAALQAMADALRDGMRDILTANAADVDAYHGTDAFLDRLTLTPGRASRRWRGGWRKSRRCRTR